MAPAVRVGSAHVHTWIEHLPDCPIKIARAPNGDGEPETWEEAAALFDKAEPAELHNLSSDLARLLDATRHLDLGPELDAIRARLERSLHP